MDKEDLLLKLDKVLLSEQIDLSQEEQEKVVFFINTLLSWNKIYNLTAIKDIDGVLYKHILDSFVLKKKIDFHQYESIIDVGTGPGFPGIPLSIIYPSIHFTLLDSCGKKTRFLQHIKTSLKLNNVDIINERVENVKDKTFDLVLSRGTFSSLDDGLTKINAICKAKGDVILMKGKQEEVEKNIENRDFVIDKIEQIKLSGPDWHRCLVYIKKMI